jgi:8-oxo-dGTP diphosphatase
MFEGKNTQAALCFLVRGSEVLLARKKAKIGAGLWNGYGGLHEPEDASLEDTVVREIKEETNGLVNIDKTQLRKIATITYHNHTEDSRRKDILVHFYTYEWNGGKPDENESMGIPEWFPVSDIPYDEMLPTDKEWMPRAFLKGLFTEGEVYHAKDGGVEKSSFTTDQK